MIDETGARQPNADVHWATENPAVATISPYGVVTAIAAGQTQIAASKGGRSTVAPVTVSSLPPALVRVNPTASIVLVGATTPLSAEVRDAGGGILTGRVITWTSASPGIATVNSSGRVTGVGVGNAVITAATAGLTGTAVVTVRPVPVASVSLTPVTGTVAIGQTLQFTATARDSTGRILTGRVIAWSSSSVATATVNGTGLVRGIAKGTATITTTSEGKTATAAVTVP